MKTENRHILYLSYDGLTDPLGQSQILPYLKGISEAGYQFHIVSFEKEKYFHTNEQAIIADIEDSPITWYPQQYHKRPPILSTLFDLRMMYRVAIGIHQKHAIQLVHCRSYPAGLIGLKLKKKLGIKFLFDIRGFWANERVDGNIWDLKNPIYRTIYSYFKRKEIAMMEAADHIVSLTHAGKEEIASGRLFDGKHTGIVSEKITVIPCAVDLTLFDPKKIEKQDQETLRAQLGITDCKDVFVYLGSLGTWYLLDEMLLYFKDFLQNQPQSKFLFVIKDDPEAIYFACDRLGVDRANVVITSASRDEVPLHLSVGTKGIFFIKPTYSKKASSAVKMGEMMAMGLEIVTNKGVGDVECFAANKSSDKINNLEVIGLVKTLEFESYNHKNSLKAYCLIYERILSI